MRPEIRTSSGRVNVPSGHSIRKKYVRVEDGPFVFKDKITVYQCSVCSFMRFEPKTAA
jgi:hypothetical protein